MSFLIALRGWHDFYVGMGVASAALLGFVFLGLTQRGDNMGGRGELHTLEGQTLGSLFGILVLSLLILIPEQNQKSLGIILLIAGILELAYVGRYLWQEARGHLKHMTAGFLAWKVVLPLAVVAATVFSSLMLLAGTRNSGAEGLYVFAATLLALLVVTARNAWELTGRSGQERLKLHRGNRS